MRSANRVWLIIGGMLIVLAIIATVLILTRNGLGPSNTPPTGTDQQSYDQNSGENLSSPAGRSPDVYGLLKDTPVYLGIANLLDYGLTDTQTQDAKYAYYLYVTSTNPHIKQVSIGKDITTVPHNPNDTSGKFAITFNTVFDNSTTMKTKIEYFNTDSIQLYMHNSSGQIKFDSGIITNKTVEAK